MSTPGDLGNGTTAIGNKALQKQKTTIIGRDDTAGGHESLENLNPSMNESTAFGSQALTDNAVGENSAFGAYAAARVGGTHNTAVGNWAMRYVQGANDNTAMGHRAMAGDENTEANPSTEPTGERNTAFGSEAMRYSPDGDDNTAIGYRSMQNIVGDASNNTALGSYSLANIKHVSSKPDSGYGNTAVGDRAGVTLKKGHRNTLMGKESGSSITKGYLNTAIGINAGKKIKTGSNNTFLGSNADSGADINADKGEYRTAIGADSKVEQDHSIILGRADPLNTMDRVGIRTTTPESALHVKTGNVTDTGIKAETAGDGHAIQAITSGKGNAVYAETLTDVSALPYPPTQSAAIKAVTNGPKTGHAIEAITESPYGNAIYASTNSSSTAIVAETTGTGNGIDVNLTGTSTSTGIKVVVDGLAEGIHVLAKDGVYGIRATHGSTSSFPVGFLSYSAIEASNQSPLSSAVALLARAESNTIGPAVLAITKGNSINSHAIQAQTVGSTSGNAVNASTLNSSSAIKAVASSGAGGHAVEAITTGAANAINASTTGTTGTSAAILATTSGALGGPGISASTASTNASNGPAIRAVTSSNVNYAVESITNSSQPGIHATSTSTGHAIEAIASSSSSGNGINASTSSDAHAIFAETIGASALAGNAIYAENSVTSQVPALVAATNSTHASGTGYAIEAFNSSASTSSAIHVKNNNFISPSSYGISLSDSASFTQGNLIHSVASGNGNAMYLEHQNVSSASQGVALFVNGGQRWVPRFINADYQVISNDYIIVVVEPTAGPVTITLPPTAGNNGSEFIIRNASLNNVIIQVTPFPVGDTIYTYTGSVISETITSVAKDARTYIVDSRPGNSRYIRVH